VYPAVIASEAKQSIAQQERKLDCFAALAMTLLKYVLLLFDGVDGPCSAALKCHSVVVG
jgi:hypothetical protein